MSSRANTRPVVFVLYDGLQMLDLAGPAEVFAMAAGFGADGIYDIHYIAPAGRLLKSSTFPLCGDPASATPSEIHTLVVPGGPQQAIESALADDVFIAWLRDTAERATRVVSVCSGAFLLGAMGLLDGRRVATHWSTVDRLAQAVPRARVDGDALFVEDGRIWTSAGVTAGIDLALALVARDLGTATALEIARELVVPLVRPGGQSQFSRPLSLQARAEPDLARLVPWLEARLQEPLTVRMMAEAMGMSDRSFQRRCSLQFGLAPARLLSELRLERAKALLSDPKAQLAAVALQSGFADASALSKAFRKRFGSAPANHRNRFRL
ncbi:MAG: GlxA family transcriptional regulator [Thermaurantiacus sp.]